MNHDDQKSTENVIFISNSKESAAKKLEAQYITQEFSKRNDFQKRCSKNSSNENISNGTIDNFISPDCFRNLSLEELSYREAPTRGVL